MMYAFVIVRLEKHKNRDSVFLIRIIIARKLQMIGKYKLDIG